MFVDRMCCAASLGPSQDVCVRRGLRPMMSARAALAVPRGPSMFVDRTCGHVRRRAAPCGAARRGITRTVGRPQLGLAASGGSSMFAVSVRRVSGAALNTFVGDAQDVCVRAHRDPHRPQSDRGARCPTGAVDVRRSQVLRGAAWLGPSLDRSTASQSAAAPRCSRLRSFEALGAGPRLVDRFVGDRPYPIERAPSKQRRGRAPCGAFS